MLRRRAVAVVVVAVAAVAATPAWRHAFIHALREMDSFLSFVPCEKGKPVSLSPCSERLENVLSRVLFIDFVLRVGYFISALDLTLALPLSLSLSLTHTHLNNYLLPHMYLAL